MKRTKRWLRKQRELYPAVLPSYLLPPIGGNLVFDPSFGVVQKPGLVGRYRPHWRAPNVEGLWFASETFRSRGIGVDRASRAGLTAAEDYLGKRLPGLEDSWRY